MKHNNVLPNAHFHKEWQNWVKTWFDQPSRKAARRAARSAKAAKAAPRPLQLLRPVVRGQTQRYNGKVRAGRGFTIDELKAAGIYKRAALGLGITIDFRRRNRSEESFALNVQRLKNYHSKLIIFPRKPSLKKAKAGDAKKEETKAAKQILDHSALEIKDPFRRPKARAIKKEEKTANVRRVLRKALTDSKRWGQRIKRKEEKDAEKAGKAKKAGKEEAAAGGDDE